jgi:hypothetical protein
VVFHQIEKKEVLCLGAAVREGMDERGVDGNAGGKPGGIDKDETVHVDFDETLAQVDIPSVQ